MGVGGVPEGGGRPGNARRPETKRGVTDGMPPPGFEGVTVVCCLPERGILAFLR